MSYTLMSIVSFLFIGFVIVSGRPREGGEENCGCDEENREMMHQLQGKLLQMTAPHHLVKQRAADMDFDMTLRDVRSHSQVPHLGALPSPSISSSHFHSPQAKVNEYFYKSDSSNVIHPFSFRGKDGRMYTNYRPDNGMPIDQVAAASRHHHHFTPPPIPSHSLTHPHPPRFMMRRETRSLLPPPQAPVNPANGPSIVPKMFNGAWNAGLKRSDGEDYGYNHGYGIAQRGISPMWTSYQSPEWAASNIAPVTGRLHPGHSVMNPITPSAAMMGRVNPMDPPINLNNWYNFLNQPFFGPMGAPQFHTMESPQPEAQSSGETTEKSSSNSNSSEESSDKKPSSRQRSRWQINFSRIPIANLRNLFRINPTSTTEAPNESNN